MKIALIFLIILFSTHALAFGASGFVKSESLTVRNSPREDGGVVRTVDRGFEFKVYDMSSGWYRISPTTSNPQWINADFVCFTKGCAPSASTTSTLVIIPQPRRIEPPKYNPEADKRPEQRAQRPSSSSASCPCSGNSNCIGPKGGRYCITSNGNKNYRD